MTFHFSCPQCLHFTFPWYLPPHHPENPVQGPVQGPVPLCCSARGWPKKPQSVALGWGEAFLLPLGTLPSAYPSGSILCRTGGTLRMILWGPQDNRTQYQITRSCVGRKRFSYFHCFIFQAPPVFLSPSKSQSLFDDTVSFHISCVTLPLVYLVSQSASIWGKRYKSIRARVFPKCLHLILEKRIHTTCGFLNTAFYLPVSLLTFSLSLFPCTGVRAGPQDQLQNAQGPTQCNLKM